MSTPAAELVLVPAAWVQVPTSEAIPRKVTFTVPETAVWLGLMPFGETPGSPLYRTATQRVRRMIQRGELRQRSIGCKSYLIPGDSIREYLAGCDEPLVSKEAS